MADFQWGDLAYLMLACALTTLPGLLGFVFPKKWVKKYMGIFLSVGIGCLLATVFLHIVPEMMEVSQDESVHSALDSYRKYTLHGVADPAHAKCGGHDHGHGSQAPGHVHGPGCNHDHDHDGPEWTPIAQYDKDGVKVIGISNPPKAAHHHCDHKGNQRLGFAFLIGIMIAFIMETFLHNHDHGDHCGHDHGHGDAHDHAHSISCHTQEHVHTASCGHSSIEMNKNLSESVDTKETGEHVHGADCGHSHESEEAGFTTSVIFMLVAQMLHHFCDGVLLGSLFANKDKPISQKMITTLAFFAHEFGQSISGYAVYINEGWSTASSVGLVLLGYAPMYISAAAIFAVAASSKQIQHFFTLYCPPLATGFFLFIVLADMVPDVVHYHKDTKWQNAAAVLLSLAAVAVMVIFIPHEH